MNIIKPYLETRKICEQINKSNKDGVRSAKRTDILNNQVKKYLQQFFKEEEGYTIHLEQKIPCSLGNTFTVDVLIKKKKKDFLICNLKAIQSNYNKNRFNYANTTVGETTRIYGHQEPPKNLHTIFLDWIPNTLPKYDKNKKIIGYEHTNIPNLDNTEKISNKWLREYNSSVCYIKIRFDYNEKTNTAKNITGDNKLKKYLEVLV